MCCLLYVVHNVIADFCSHDCIDVCWYRWEVYLCLVLLVLGTIRGHVFDGCR